MRRVGLLAIALSVASGAAGQGAPTPDLLPTDVRIRFQTADLDQSGTLSRDEATRSGYSATAFAAVDRDGDQIVTVAEVATYLADRTREWASADSDRDEAVSAEEAEQAPTLKAIFTAADTDRDGSLRRQEHEAWAQTTLYQNVDLPYVVPNILKKKF
jgi:Ca2+-binding EF-hand superfamily protein